MSTGGNGWFSESKKRLALEQLKKQTQLERDKNEKELTRAQNDLIRLERCKIRLHVVVYNTRKKDIEDRIQSSLKKLGRVIEQKQLNDKLEEVTNEKTKQRLLKSIITEEDLKEITTSITTNSTNRTNMNQTLTTINGFYNEQELRAPIPPATPETKQDPSADPSAARTEEEEDEELAAERRLAELLKDAPLPPPPLKSKKDKQLEQRLNTLSIGNTTSKAKVKIKQPEFRTSN